MPTIHFLDVTNRDGVQTARTGLSKFGKVMVNFYLGRLGVAQSEIGFPFLFHEAPYVRACVALAEAGAFGDLRLSGWCRAVPGDVESALPLALRHYNLSISTSDQMLACAAAGAGLIWYFSVQVAIGVGSLAILDPTTTPLPLSSQSDDLIILNLNSTTRAAIAEGK